MTIDIDSLCGDKFKQIFRNIQTKQKKSYHKRPNPPHYTVRSQQDYIPISHHPAQNPDKKNPPLQLIHPESQGRIHIVPSQVTYPFYTVLIAQANKESTRRPALPKHTEDWRFLQSSVYILPPMIGGRLGEWFEVLLRRRRMR